MRKLVIEKEAVRSNMAVIRKRAAGAALYGVLTGDAGGAGLVPMARMLRNEGVNRFAVGSAEEAQALREAGFLEEEILMLRATVDREELEHLVDLNVVCTISSVDTGLALNAVAENRATIAEAHIQVDTGMGFGGFLVGEPEKILPLKADVFVPFDEVLIDVQSNPLDTGIGRGQASNAAPFPGKIIPLRFRKPLGGLFEPEVDICLVHILFHKTSFVNERHNGSVIHTVLDGIFMD